MTQDKKSINSHIDEYLNYYCKLSAPGFAVLLKGEWGAGKTWYINKYQEQAKEHNIKFLYISLYGMSSSSEIDDTFLKLLDPFWSSKGMAVTGKIFKGLLKGALKIDLTGDGKDEGTWNIQVPDINLPNHLKNIDKSILIFDDLERCKLEIGSLLGYINHFVEQQDMKVIIIANESVLLDTENNSSGIYKAIKEKLIGKTFDVSPDFQEALEDFISQLKDTKVKDCLKDSNELIQRVYEESEYKNLRNLKQILFDFERIFEALPEKAKHKKKLCQDLLKFLIAFSAEIRRGKLDPKEISKLPEKHALGLAKRISQQQINSDAQNTNSEENSFQTLLARYKTLDLHSPFPNEMWWQIFFDTGTIDIKRLEDLLPNSEYFQDENTPNWARLWHYENLEDDKFDDLLKKVELEYINREFRELGEIKHVVGLFLRLSDIELYRKSKEEILWDAKDYIDYLRSISYFTEQPSNSEIYHSFERYGELSFRGRDFEEFKEFSIYINEAQEQSNLEHMPKAAQNLLDIMQSDTWKFYGMISLENSHRLDTQDQNYYQVPIFKYTDKSVFMEKFLSMNRETRHIVLWALEERYKFKNEALLEELDWLKAIQCLLLEEAKRNKGRLSGHILALLAEYDLADIIAKLENDSPSQTG